MEAEKRKEVEKKLASGKGDHIIAKELGLTRHAVRKVRAEMGLAALPIDPSSPIFRGMLLKSLRSRISFDKLSQKLKCSRPAIESAIDHLESSGYILLREGPMVSLVRGLPGGGTKYVDLAPLTGEKYTFGTISDTHLCSHSQRLDIMEEAYDEFAKRKIADVYHAGNIVDGHTNFNRFEIYAHGITDQAIYVCDNYPQRKGVTTHFVTGECHEGWWMKREGLDFGRYLMGEARDRGRPDLHYIGFMEVDVEIKSKGGSSILRIMHPGGGSSYATSYATQKIVESLQGGEKPAAIICGHFHKHIWHEVRNVEIFQAMCCQDQTPFMRKKRIAANIGYWIITFEVDARGAVRHIIAEKYRRFDRGYHISKEVITT